MKKAIVYLVVCFVTSVFSTSSLGAKADVSRGGIAPSDLNDVVVVGTSIDTLTQVESVDLMDYGSMPVKKENVLGMHRLTLALTDANDYRIHQLLAFGGAYNFSFDASGAITRVEFHGLGIYAKPPVTRAQLQIDALNDVAIDSVALDIAKATATFALRQNPGGCRAQQISPLQKGSRCPSTGEPAMALVLDLCSDTDLKTFDLLLGEAANAGRLSLGFDAKGQLASMQVYPYFIPGGCK